MRVQLWSVLVVTSNLQIMENMDILLNGARFMNQQLKL